MYISTCITLCGTCFPLRLPMCHVIKMCSRGREKNFCTFRCFDTTKQLRKVFIFKAPVITEFFARTMIVVAQDGYPAKKLCDEAGNGRLLKRRKEEHTGREHFCRQPEKRELFRWAQFTARQI